MTNAIPATKAAAASGRKPSDRTRLLVNACMLGVIVGALFILVQPLFGMDTLTSRHAALYQQLGGWSAVPAMTIAWSAHLVVSVMYGLMSAAVVMGVSRPAVVAMFTMALAWLTTVIAPPANAVIVQLVSFQHVDAARLPGLNFKLDEKLVLHLVFFAAITGVLYVYKMNKSSRSQPHRLAVSPT